MPAVWKGSLTFGLVNVPVELRRAVDDQHLSFRMLDSKGHSPIQYKRVREGTSSEVPWKEIVKGYEVSKGEFVVLTDDDFKEAAIAQSNTIDIQEFIDVADVDPRLYETSYFLVPGKGGQKVYALLRDAMADTAAAGIGTIIIHRRQHIAEIRAEGKALILMILRFANELVDADDLNLPAASRGSPRELQMAAELIKTLHTKFDPTKYRDEYEANLMRIIKARAKGKTVHLEGRGTEGREPKVIDLMERLQRSLAGAKAPAKSEGKATNGRHRATPRRSAKRTGVTRRPAGRTRVRRRQTA